MQRDNCSNAWLQALPSSDTCLSNAEFSEAGAAALQLPSPACMEKLGQTVGGRQAVDPHGEVVQATIGCWMYGCISPRENMYQFVFFDFFAL